MDKKISLSIRLELIWWIVTLLVIIGILFPIYKVNRLFLFWTPNIVYILVFITFTRYLFLLKHTFLGRTQWAKAILAILCIPVFMYLLDAWTAFRYFVDDGSLLASFQHLTIKGQDVMVNYVRAEMFFFGVGSMIVTAIMPVRMVISVWRTHNRGTV